MKNKQNTYYRIREQSLGKKEDGKYFLFQNAKWVPDENHVITDLLVGFDPSEPEDSPYRIGNTSVLFEMDEITEDQAISLINQQLLDFLK